MVEVGDKIQISFVRFFSKTIDILCDEIQIRAFYDRCYLHAVELKTNINTF